MRRPASPRRRAATRRGACWAVFVVIGAAAVGCSGPTDDARFTVAVSFFPIAELATNIALDDAVDVVSIVPPGEEAHDYEPTPRQMTELEDADLVLYFGGGLQPAIERAILTLPATSRLDLLDQVDLIAVGPEIGSDEAHDEPDPHVWLSPARMAALAGVVGEAIAARLDDQAAARVRAAASTYAAALGELDDEFADGLAVCEQQIVVTGHHAFGYLANDYGLTQVSISGISPSEEPSAETLQQVAEFAEQNGVTTIFFEENLPADLSRTIADEVGATTARLDPAESPSAEQLGDGATYVSLMRANLQALRAGLGCR